MRADVDENSANARNYRYLKEDDSGILAQQGLTSTLGGKEESTGEFLTDFSRHLSPLVIFAFWPFRFAHTFSQSSS